MAEPAEGLIKKLDKGLEEYYKAFNRKDYINSDGIGKFIAFANDNGFEDEDIKDELEQENVADCTLTEFDNDEDGNCLFPLNPPIHEETARNKQILEILKSIAETGGYKTSPGPTPGPEPKVISISESDLMDMAVNVNQKDIDEAIAKYQLQMTCFGNNFQKDEALQRFFGVSEKRKIPFITYMVDCYTKDKAKYFEKTGDQNPMTVGQWSHNNGFMNKLRKQHPNTATQLVQAMVSYSNRIMTRLHFAPTVTIKDSLKEICEYIASVPAFIQKIMEKHAGSPPFQVDLLIAVKAVKSEVDADGDEDDDDDDDDDSKDNGAANVASLDPTKDHVGPIEKELKDFPVAYAAIDIDNNDEAVQAEINGIARIHAQRYQDLRTVLSEWDQHHPHDDDGDDDKDDGYPPRRKYNEDTYPQNRRFSIFVDRRENIDGDNKEEHQDQIIYFQPPNNCNSMQNDHVPEFGFELIRRCIIPIKVNGEIKHKTALDSLCGQLLSFMFNVEQKDEIKCYIVWNGQTMRFFGEHILSVLPNLFQQTKENKQFKIDTNHAQAMEKSFNENVIDTQFDRFYQVLTSYK